MLMKMEFISENGCQCYILFLYLKVLILYDLNSNIPLLDSVVLSQCLL